MTALSVNWKERGRAAVLHFGASLALAALAAWLVFGVWFPYPYREVSGGRNLFVLLVSVDVVIGPLLTLVVFNRAKPSRELWRDLAVIAMLQLAALGYGLRTVYEVRPIYLVHEVDRFKVITPADIDRAELTQARPEFRELPLHGVQMIGVRPARDAAENLSAIESALAGRDISAMPQRWQALDDANRAQIRARARDMAFLRARAADGGAELDRLIATAGLKPDQVIALPLVARSYDWSVLMDAKDLRIIGYLPIDAF